MRNLFDQYKSPENRLTHALACSLREDPRLLRSFVRWAIGEKPPPGHLHIVEQTLPGEPEATEEEAEQRGLPDAWIYGVGPWSLIIESKVAAPVQAGQLRRHMSTAARREFTDATLLVLSPEEPAERSLAGARHRTWSQVYAWLKRQEPESPWARKLTGYMEVAEHHMTATEYLTKGSLTTFTGIRFDADNPYSYYRAKSMLHAAMVKLRANKKLHKLGVDPKGEGRPAITGRDQTVVWDILPLKLAKSGDQFTSYPHLTIAIHSDRVVAIMIFPNNMRPEFRRNFKQLTREEFRETTMDIAAKLTDALKDAEGAQPWIEVAQRHFKGRRSKATIDARLEFDLRTVMDERDKRRHADKVVKTQPQWLDAAYDALHKRRSNMQLSIGANFPLSCPALHGPDATDYFAGTWLACKPMLDAVVRGRTH